MQVADVVQLLDGSVGVVSEIANGAYRVHFRESNKMVNDDFVSAILSAPTYSAGDHVSLWPYAGIISMITGDDFTLRIERQEAVDRLGPVTWSGVYKAPRWRIIRDNDTRIKRAW